MQEVQAPSASHRDVCRGEEPPPSGQSRILPRTPSDRPVTAKVSQTEQDRLCTGPPGVPEGGFALSLLCRLGITGSAQDLRVASSRRPVSFLARELLVVLVVAALVSARVGGRLGVLRCLVALSGVTVARGDCPGCVCASSRGRLCWQKGKNAISGISVNMA